MLFYGISFHKKLLEIESSGWDAVTQSGKYFDDLKKEVGELLPNDNASENDEITDIDNLCTLALARELSGKQEEIKSMLKTIDEWLNKPENNNSSATASVINLSDFLKSIVDTHEFSNAGAGSSQESYEKQQFLEWDKKKKKNGLVQKINIIDRWWRFSSTLTNIKTVLDNPTPSNVKQLQQYIFDAVYAKLSVSEQNSFKSDTRFSNSGWNWLIDAELLEWVGIVLTRIENTLRSEVTDRRTVGGISFNQQVQNVQVATWVQIFLMEASSSSGWDGQSVEASNGVQSEDVEPHDNEIYNIAKDRLHLSEWEKICLMDVAWKKYLVKLDSGNCLYPLALSVHWNNIWNTVLLQNNSSCMEYLRKKIPDVPYCSNMDISWNGKKYVIWVPGSKRLTIEPMTFDGKWLGGANLDQSLALLCFVNYLRNSKDFNGYEFKNDNPDLDWDDWKLLVAIKKNKDAKKASWEKDKALVDLTTYGLWFLSDGDNDDIRRRFIRYNNWEHREDNWNKKGDNQGYWALDVQQVMEEQQRLQATARQRQQGQEVRSWSQWVGDSGEEGQRSVDSSYQTLSLIRIDGDFNCSGFWINSSEGNPQIFESGADNDKTYYWKEWNTLCSVSEKTPYLKFSKNFNWDIRTDQQLDVGDMTATLNVCEKWKDSLMSKIKSVHEEIYWKGANFDAEIITDNDTYVLQWPKDWSEKNEILLWGDKFVVDDKIFEYDIDKPEDWMKVVLYAKENYEDVTGGKQLILNSRNEYGITRENRDVVKSWLNSLNGDGGVENSDLVVLPWSLDGIGNFDESGTFTFNEGFIVDSGVLTIDSVKYSKEPNDWLWYLCTPDNNDGSIWYLYLWNFIEGSAHWQWTRFFSDGDVLQCNFENSGFESWWKFTYTWSKKEGQVSPTVLEWNFSGVNFPTTWTITFYEWSSEHKVSVTRDNANSNWKIESSDSYNWRIIDYSTWELLSSSS